MTNAAYGQYHSVIDKTQLPSRADEILLARLRVGHHSSLRAYLHRIDPDIDPTCPRCKED